MLVLFIIIIMFTNSLNHQQINIHSVFIKRLTMLVLLVSIFLSYNVLYFQLIGKGVTLYNDLFQVNLQSQIMEIILLFIGISIFAGFPLFSIPAFFSNKAIPNSDVEKLTVTNFPSQTDYKTSNNINNKEEITMDHNLSITPILPILSPFLSQRDKERSLNVEHTSEKIVEQYSLIAIFSILGGSLLMSSLDLLSMYLSIELQSFALYILATLNKDNLSSTSAGLKYFLLGGLSSCFILLGSAIIYSYTGLTQLEEIYTLISVPFLSEITEHNNWLTIFEIIKPFNIGIILILVGFLFKVSAAPFHQWAPDVYDATPTIVTVWLTIVAKFTIFIFILEMLDFSLPNIYEELDKILPFSIPLDFSNVTEDVKSNILHSFGSWSIESINTNNFSLLGNNLSNLQFEDNKIENFNYLSLDIIVKNLLLICSLLSLIIGTVAGLSQIKIKRLLAFSSVSHVGFLLLSLGIYTQKSIDSFIFYLIQYSITSLNIFLIILAFGYLINNISLIEEKQTNSIASYKPEKQPTLQKGYSQSYRVIDPHLNFFNINKKIPNIASFSDDIRREYLALNIGKGTIDQSKDINFLLELKGQFISNPILSISLGICLFSMAGIPPLIGFFSKQFVLFSSIENGNVFLSIIAILVSVISASYYLKLINIIFFSDTSQQNSTIFLNPSIYKKPFFSSSFYNFPNKNNSFSGFLSSNELNDGNPISLISSDLNKGNKSDLSLPSKGVQHDSYLELNNLHSFIISLLNFIISIFFINPSIILNGSQLITLTFFNF